MRRALLMVGVLALGCAPADRYEPKSPKQPEPVAKHLPSRPSTLPPGLAWMTPDRSELKPDIPIEFIHETTQPAEWNSLPSLWNLKQTSAPTAQQAVSFLGLTFPVHAPATAAVTPVVRIKIPSGLDPINADLIPVANPPTVGKWRLGKQLFFDDGYLQPDEAMVKRSCASCHRPVHAFTDGMLTPFDWSFNTPTLVNVVYNRRFFWDGRADHLEQVLQRTLEDERESEPHRHVWSGVIRRLQRSAEYDQRFREVFGAPPTQDAVGKALATYLRTILSGDSLHDRAERARRERGGKELEPGDYEKVLDDATVRAVLLEPPDKDQLPKKPDVATQLHLGYTLFHGKGRCSACHTGANFTDQAFHNLGVEQDIRSRYLPGHEPGRFAAQLVGLKDWNMIGAYKTPTLRALISSRPYFHNGLRNDLFEVVQFHVQGSRIDNPDLDPVLRAPNNPLHHRDFGLKEDEVRALVMFLKSLDGAPIDPMVADAARRQ